MLCTKRIEPSGRMSDIGYCKAYRREQLIVTFHRILSIFGINNALDKVFASQGAVCGFRPKMRNISSDQRLAPVRRSIS
jgi:hypothetical protein